MISQSKHQYKLNTDMKIRRVCSGKLGHLSISMFLVWLNGTKTFFSENITTCLFCFFCLFVFTCVTPALWAWLQLRQAGWHVVIKSDAASEWDPINISIWGNIHWLILRTLYFVKVLLSLCEIINMTENRISNTLDEGVSKTSEIGHFPRLIEFFLI